ncbi:MAG TPA: hypothetical protein VID04_08925 [Methylomirabilota bacterium]|jgi:hypothetical protein
MDQLEPLRGLVTIAIKDATALLARLKALDEALATLVPPLAVMTTAERNAYVARLCEYDETLPDRLRGLVEGLADLLAGLTSTDGGRAWLLQHTARLEGGETVEAA